MSQFHLIDAGLTRSRRSAAVRSRRRGRCSYATGAVDCSAAKRAIFSYDRLGRETSMQVLGSGPERRTDTAYWKSGLIRERSRWRIESGSETSHITDTYDYFEDGRLKRMTRRPGPGQPLSKDLSYAYDKNGNRLRDERGTYTFDPRNYMRTWDRDSDEPNAEAGDRDLVTYTVNGDGAVEFKDDRGLEAKTDYRYRGERLIEVKLKEYGSSPLTTTSSFEYNELGNVKKITATAPGRATSTVTYAYDDFERRTCSYGAGAGSSGESFTYSYDAFDRRDYRRKQAGTQSCNSTGPQLDHSYIGTSEKLSREQEPSGSGTDVRTYDYDSQGRRQGQFRDVASGPDTYRSYALDANGSVEGLEKANGEVSSNERYDYDPYGELQEPISATESVSDMDAESALASPAKENPFRFEGFYYDSGVKTYDMQARSYRPDTGRFLTADRYEGALSDQLLQSDPLTQNRYAFAGGNPVSNIEFDGHCGFSSFEDFVDCGGQVAEFVGDVATAGYEYLGSAVMSVTAGSGGSVAAPPPPQAVAAAPPPTSAFTSLPPPDILLARKDSAIDQAYSEGSTHWDLEDYPPQMVFDHLHDLRNPTEGNPLAILHGALASCGAAPVVGEPCDAVDAIVYLVEGDEVGAVMSAGGTVPLLGSASGPARIVRLGAKYGDEAGAVAKARLPRFDGPKPKYDVNPAHVPGRGLRHGKTPLPADAEDVFRHAVPNDPANPTAWFGRNDAGQIYRYSPDNVGGAHFSGIDGVGDGVRNLTRYALGRLDGQ